MSEQETIPIKLTRKSLDAKVDDLLIRMAVVEIQIKHILSLLTVANIPLSHKKTV